MPKDRVAVRAIGEEDAMRARLYGVLARLLARPPDAALLEELGGLGEDATELGRAFGELGARARATTPEAANREYHRLFIGLGRGELVPFGSYYLTGFLNEKPLARLRASLSAIGVERPPEVKEPEDHIAVVLDVMAGLILGTWGGGSPATERAFFEEHVASWAGPFFKDLEAAENAAFYRPVGAVGRQFIAIERTAFGMG